MISARCITVLNDPSHTARSVFPDPSRVTL
jgi:hypothetical protein